MTTFEIGTKLVELCSKSQNHVALDTLYSDDIVSVEAGAPPGQSAEKSGIADIKAKSQWWMDNHEIHSAECVGPFPHGDRFIVRFVYDVTFKPTGQRHTMDEMALYTVAGGKIVREEFFYTMG